MNIEESVLKPNSGCGSGQVRGFDLNGSKARITQITTFCPDVIGPGAAHLYLIETDALVLLDTGIPTDLAKTFFYLWRNQPMPPEVEQLPPDHSAREFREGLRLAGYAASDIDLIVISHGHPDHFLMARSLMEATNAVVAAHILDTPPICNPWGLFSAWFARQPLMKAIGMPSAWSGKGAVKEETLLGIDLDAMGLGTKVSVPVFGNGPLKLNGSAVRGVEVEHLPGHSPGSIGLTVAAGAEKVLLCGDVLLNPITPHPDDLLVYLRTLDQLGRRDDLGFVLPAHGQEITDLKDRVRFIQEHHHRRLRMTYEACAEPCSAWDLATKEGYFDTYVNPRNYNPMAGTEALVHMELLGMADGLRRAHTREEVHYFQNSGESFDEVYARILDLVRDKSAGGIMRY